MSVKAEITSLSQQIYFNAVFQLDKDCAKMVILRDGPHVARYMGN